MHPDRRGEIQRFLSIVGVIPIAFTTLACQPTKDSTPQAVSEALRIMRQERPECWVNDVDRELQDLQEQLFEDGKINTLNPIERIDNIGRERLKVAAGYIQDEFGDKAGRSAALAEEYLFLAKKTSEIASNTKFREDTRAIFRSFQQCYAVKAASLLSGKD